jgi:hypothetical protein
MCAALLYDNDVDKGMHMYAIHRLSIDHEIPEDKVLSLYEEVLGGLKENARVRDFLSVLATKKVKDILIHRY